MKISLYSFFVSISNEGLSIFKGDFISKKELEKMELEL